MPEREALPESWGRDGMGRMLGKLDRFVTKLVQDVEPVLAGPRLRWRQGWPRPDSSADAAHRQRGIGSTGPATGWPLAS